MKPVPDMTYNVFGGTLNLAQLQKTSVLVRAVVAERYVTYEVVCGEDG